jgi:hypothetical protein
MNAEPEPKGTDPTFICLYAPLFGESHVRFVQDLLRRPATFLVDECRHQAVLRRSHHDPADDVHRPCSAEAMITRDQVQLNGKDWIVGQQFLHEIAAPLR